jgi:hypothetical protein
MRGESLLGKTRYWRNAEKEKEKILASRNDIVDRMGQHILAQFNRLARLLTNT